MFRRLPFVLVVVVAIAATLATTTRSVEAQETTVAPPYIASCRSCIAENRFYCTPTETCYASSAYCRSNCQPEGRPDAYNWCVSSSSDVEQLSCSSCAVLPSSDMIFNNNAPAVSCQAQSGCAWCNLLGVCASSSSQCASCFTLPESSCTVLPMPGGCTWCDSFGQCAPWRFDRQEKNCACPSYTSQEMCSNISACTWCDNMDVCLNASTTDCSAGCEAVPVSECPMFGSVCALTTFSTFCVNASSCAYKYQQTAAACNSDPACTWCNAAGLRVSDVCASASTNCSAGCSDLDYDSCVLVVPGSCQWCPSFGACISENAPYKDSVFGRTQQCSCSAMPESACQRGGVCVWQDGFCINTSSCAYRYGDAAGCNGDSACTWCKHSDFGIYPGVCADTSTNCSAGCYSLSYDACTVSETSTGACTWCPWIGTCIPSNATSAEAALPHDGMFEQQQCSCLEVQRAAVARNLDAHSQCSQRLGCQWCAGLCIDVSSSTNCHGCYNISNNACVAPSCHWCSGWVGSPAFSSCAAKSNAVVGSSPSDTLCDCGHVNVTDCGFVSACATMPPLFDVGHAPAYCGAASLASCPPLTCPSILSNAACVAAGCSVLDPRRDPAVVAAAETNCALPNGCVTILLPSLTLLPLALVFLGAFKDIITLILVGAYGDYFKRRGQHIVHQVKHWLGSRCQCCECCAAGVKQRHVDVLEKTVYMADDIARRGCNFSFEEYVKLVAAALFEIPDDVALDCEHAQQLLFDAVALALSDNGVWIFLPGLKGDLPEASPASSTADSGDDNDEPLLNSASAGAGYSKKTLAAEDFSSRRKLFAAVEQQIDNTPHTSHVYYAGSSDRYKNIAANLVAFPTSLQLGWYATYCSIMMIATLFSVLVTNYDLVQAVGNPACHYTTSSGNSTSTTNAASASFFLIAARLANTSMWSTAFLVFVKAARAIYQLHSEDFSSMPLGERLPVMGLASRRSTQLTLLLYTALILPFAVMGVTFGFAVGSPLAFRPYSTDVTAAPLPALVALGAVFLLFLARRYSARCFTYIGRRCRCCRKSAAGNGEATSISQQQGDASSVVSSSVSLPLLPDADAVTTAFLIQREQQSPQATDGNDIARLSPRGSDDAAPDTDNSSGKYLRSKMLLFLLDQELPLLLLSVGFQLAVSYTVMLHWAPLFGINEASGVWSLDWKARSFKCLFEQEVEEAAHALGILSSFVPFS